MRAGTRGRAQAAEWGRDDPPGRGGRSGGERVPNTRSSLREPRRHRVMHSPLIVHVTAECWPFARTGGLGEAVAGLVRAQQSACRPLRIILPLYPQARLALAQAGCELQPREPIVARHAGDDVTPLAFVRRARARGARDTSPSGLAARALSEGTLFVESDGAFARPGIYGEDGSDYADNAARFGVLGMASVAAVLELTSRCEGRPIVLHAHDWHGAFAVLALHAAARRHPPLRAVAAVLTVHNAAYQGPDGDSGPIGMSASEAMRAHGTRCASPLQAALRMVDAATTVSPTHAAELRTEEGGFGLDGEFRALGDRFRGIRNGLDVAIWRPSTPTVTPRRHAPAVVTARAEAKAELQRHLGLTVDVRMPLLGVCSRLCAQKGLDLLLEAGLARRRDLQLVVLGEGESALVQALTAAAERAPGQVAFRTPFAEDEERLLLQGADVLVMPSRFEPCGLAQLRAQHFGVVPICHAVGGLLDTVRDGDTGFLFAPFSPSALCGAVNRALGVFRDPLAWGRLVHRCRMSDVGWTASARAYDEIYALAVERALCRGASDGRASAS